MKKLISLMLALAVLTALAPVMAENGETEFDFKGETCHVTFLSAEIGKSYFNLEVYLEATRLSSTQFCPFDVSVRSGGYEWQFNSSSGFGEGRWRFSTRYGGLPEAIYIFPEYRTFDCFNEENRILLWKHEWAEEDAWVPGGPRAAEGQGYSTAQALAEDRNVRLKGMPLYKPACPQPLNAYMITHEDCEVGIDQDGMYSVSEKGLVTDITDLLTEWMGEIETASGGAIRFVDYPDQADVLICAKQSYAFYANYSGGGRQAAGYSCTVELSARQLTRSDNYCAVSEIREPEKTVTLSGGGKFWKRPPEFADTEKLSEFTETILKWYGYGSKAGSRSAGVRAARQALIDRGLLKGSAKGSFDAKTEAAVKALQKEYGLGETGEIDVRTLVALYYDQDAVKALHDTE